ncbi:MAG: hypothetical protein LUG51_07315 [Tannerellaceae bacterium]|nr:hypothetical protein [Tannerellaceae bacterium]
MKKSFINLLAVSALVFGMASCGGSQKSNEEAAKNEEAAVIAGSVPKNLLTEELKTETIQLLKDMPDSEIPYRAYSGEVKLGVGNLGYMVPTSKANDLTTNSQKARAVGIYFADLNILRAINQPTVDVEAVLAKLTADLNISYIQNVMKDKLPENASKEEFKAFTQKQQEKIIDELAANDRMDVQIEILAGMAAEYACLMANPSLVIEGDATSAGLSENMEKRVGVLLEITEDLSTYYPDLKNVGTTIAPLQTMTATITTDRNSNAEITGIRDALLK